MLQKRADRLEYDIKKIISQVRFVFFGLPVPIDKFWGLMPKNSDPGSGTEKRKKYKGRDKQAKAEEEARAGH